MYQPSQTFKYVCIRRNSQSQFSGVSSGTESPQHFRILCFPCYNTLQDTFIINIRDAPETVILTLVAHIQNGPGRILYNAFLRNASPASFPGIHTPTCLPCPNMEIHRLRPETIAIRISALSMSSPIRIVITPGCRQQKI